MPAVTELSKRYTCYRDSFGYVRCTQTGWYSYGRWIVLAVIIVAALISCISYAVVHRRRQMARQQALQNNNYPQGMPMQQPDMGQSGQYPQQTTPFHERQPCMGELLQGPPAPQYQRQPPYSEPTKN